MDELRARWPERVAQVGLWLLFAIVPLWWFAGATSLQFAPGDTSRAVIASLVVLSGFVGLVALIAMAIVVARAVSRRLFRPSAVNATFEHDGVHSHVESAGNSDETR